MQHLFLSFQTQVAVWLAQTLAALSHFLRQGAGTSLPGKIALRIAPHCIKTLSQRTRKQTIMVTGTNGKTTTSGLIVALLQQQDPQCRILHNHLGANLWQGIASAYLLWKGRAPDYAVLEVDEASLATVTQHITPQVVVMTNVFRDQLDRYGELDTTVNHLKAGVVMHPHALLVLNADDPSLTALGLASQEQALPNPTHYFSLSTTQNETLSTDNPVAFPNELVACANCGNLLHYTHISYGHLGQYHCSACQWQQPASNTHAVLTHQSVYQSVLQLDDAETPLHCPLPGTFNAYNVLAACAAVKAIQNPDAQAFQQTCQRALDHYHGVFGRGGDWYEHDGRRFGVFLMKNPVGASEVLRCVAQALDNHPNDSVLLALNDNAADGKDVSWIWDADFESLATCQHITVTGKRAWDMAVRLKYANINPNAIQVTEDLMLAVTQALAQTPPNGTLYMIPTYTNLLALRPWLLQQPRCHVLP